MSSIVMCDRCHRLGKSVALGGITFKTQMSNKALEAKGYELCPSCVGSLVEWLAEPGKAGSDVPSEPFTEPYAEPVDGEPEAAASSRSRAIGSREVNPWGDDD